MENIITVIEVIAPIFLAIFLGVLARKKAMLTPEENRGLQQFVIKFALPCVLFNSCLTAEIGAESVSSMVLVLPLVLLGTVLSFRWRKKRFPYHNLPMLFAAQETGMVGIPLFVILFGADQAFRMGVLDLTQAVTAYPVIALLTADPGENPTPGAIVKKVFSSPLLIMSLLGLALNLTGVGAWLNSVGIGGIVTSCTGFLAQPVSAVMIFSVGYNFSLAKGSRGAVFRLSAFHFGVFAVFCLLIQGLLFLVPGVDALTRWAILLYCALPASYLAPGLGRSEEDYTIASGVCSVLTVTCLIVFCCIAAFTA
ncbi:MAG: AEC family transporter [Faecousia sp.]